MHFWLAFVFQNSVAFDLMVSCQVTIVLCQVAVDFLLSLWCSPWQVHTKTLALFSDWCEVVVDFLWDDVLCVPPDITCTADWGHWLSQTLDGVCVWVSLWVLDSLLGAFCFCKGCSWILVNLCTDCVLMGCVLIPGEHTVWCQHWHHFLHWRQAQDPQPSWSCLRPPCLGLLSGKHCSLY